MLFFVSCSKHKNENGESNAKMTKSNYITLTLDTTTKNQLDIEKIDQVYELKTTGGDPYIYLKPFIQDAKEKKVLTFEYKSSADLNHLQIFFAKPISEKRSVKTEAINKATSWTHFNLDLGDKIEELSWGDVGDFLRLDFGDKANIAIRIRNIRLRERNEEEIEAAQKREEFRKNDQDFNKDIISYLSKEYTSKITNVEVTDDLIRIQGDVNGKKSAQLYEVTPYEDITALQDSESVKSLDNGHFSIELKRYVEKDGFNYDRILSKWAIGSDSKSVQGINKLYSHARFPDVIQSKYALSEGHLKNRKGLGGLRNNPLMIADLDALNIGSVTINIPVTSYVYLDKKNHTYAHEYGGKVYYFDKQKINDLDKLLLEASHRNIVVSAIILIQKAADCPDPQVGELMQNSHFTGDAFFTMPRLDNPNSINCYAAMIDFLASRYCTSANQHGRIYKWIMHNEVDAGSTWTNMGKGRPLFVYLDSYYKSMRICYTIAKKYDPHAEVLGSFTHSWNAASPGGDYAVLDMLKGLKSYSVAEGDFKWGLACHPYPEDLNDPKTWNDKDATFSMLSPLVTFKNLEVIDAWIKRPENKYKGTEKRTLWLSENGTNSPTYGEQDLLDQAAGFAYAWKQIEYLDDIDAIQWHNWMDNRGEFGLKIGLRRYPDDATDPSGKKPVWFAYQAAGTDAEDRVFNPYKKIIGIDNWKEVIKDIH